MTFKETFKEFKKHPNLILFITVIGSLYVAFFGYLLTIAPHDGWDLIIAFIGITLPFYILIKVIDHNQYRAKVEKDKEEKNKNG